MRKTLILDITPLKNGYYQDSGRSGIFFTVKNILIQLLACEDTDIYFNITRSEADDCYKAIQVVKKEFPENARFILSRCFYNNGVLAGCVDWILRATESRKSSFAGRIIRKLVRMTGKLSCSSKWSVTADVAERAEFLSLMYAVPEHVKAVIPPERRWTMLYDTIPSFFGEYANQLNSWYGRLTESLSAEDNYLAISRSSRDDFKRLFPVLGNSNIGVVPLAAAESYRAVEEKDKLAAVRAKYNIPEDKKIFFSHCSLAPHKNLERLFEAFCLIREKLPEWNIVFSGSNAPGVMGKVLEYAEKHNVPRSAFCFTGYVDDDDLPALYSLADIFCFVSLYEGFGLPVLEAMSCGTPCVVSRTSSIPEVAGDAAVYADPESVDDIAQKMLSLACDEKLQNELRTRSLARAGEFSWRKTCQLIVENLGLINI